MAAPPIGGDSDMGLAGPDFLPTLDHLRILLDLADTLDADQADGVQAARTEAAVERLPDLQRLALILYPTEMMFPQFNTDPSTWHVLSVEAVRAMTRLRDALGRLESLRRPVLAGTTLLFTLPADGPVTMEMVAGISGWVDYVQKQPDFRPEKHLHSVDGALAPWERAMFSAWPLSSVLELLSASLLLGVGRLALLLTVQVRDRSQAPAAGADLRWPPGVSDAARSSLYPGLEQLLRVESAACAMLGQAHVPRFYHGQPCAAGAACTGRGPATYRCSGCRLAQYCSTACQAVHWEAGKHAEGCRGPPVPLDRGGLPPPPPSPAAASRRDGSGGGDQRAPYVLPGSAEATAAAVRLVSDALWAAHASAVSPRMLTCLATSVWALREAAYTDALWPRMLLRAKQRVAWATLAAGSGSVETERRALRRFLRELAALSLDLQELEGREVQTPSLRGPDQALTALLDMLASFERLAMRGDRTANSLLLLQRPPWSTEMGLVDPDNDRAASELLIELADDPVVGYLVRETPLTRSFARRGVGLGDIIVLFLGHRRLVQAASQLRTDEVARAIRPPRASGQRPAWPGAALSLSLQHALAALTADPAEDDTAGGAGAAGAADLVVPVQLLDARPVELIPGPSDDSFLPLPPRTAASCMYLSGEHVDRLAAAGSIPLLLLLCGTLTRTHPLGPEKRLVGRQVLRLMRGLVRAQRTTAFIALSNGLLRDRQDDLRSDIFAGGQVSELIAEGRAGRLALAVAPETLADGVAQLHTLLRPDDDELGFLDGRLSAAQEEEILRLRDRQE